MFRRILIANRGEVAARVMRTCKRLGITAVAVYTDPDAELAYLQEVDETVHIGGKRAHLDGSAFQYHEQFHGWGWECKRKRK